MRRKEAATGEAARVLAAFGVGLSGDDAEELAKLTARQTALVLGWVRKAHSAGLSGQAGVKTPVINLHRHNPG